MIDSHHHLWAYDAEEYSWIPAGSALAADYLAAELESVTRDAGVEGTVVVQARQLLDESYFLLNLANETKRILGVVGWVPLIDEDVAVHLDKLCAHKAFVGVRHVLQGEADAYFLRDDFHRGLALLPGRALRYDLLLFQRQLPVAIQLVDRQPELPIIVDHLAKPAVTPGRVEADWRKGMQELAKRENIIGVKFSGLLTEFPAGQPCDEATVRAYFEETLEIFGAERVLFGTDWPVCLLRDGYRNWADTVRGLVASLTGDEQAAILGENARRVYGLV